VAAPEEIAWRMGYIDDDSLQRLAAAMSTSGYGQYLLGLIGEEFSGWQPEFRTSKHE